MKMAEMKLKNLSTDQGQRRVRSSLCCNWSSCNFWWDVNSDPLVQWYFYSWSLQSFLSERTAGVSSRSTTLTNMSNCLTYTVASSLVCTSRRHHRRRTPRCPHSLQLSRVKVSIADHEHTRSRIHYKFPFFQFFADAAGKLLSSVSEENVASSFSLSLQIFFASLHASQLAHRYCLSVSSWDLSSNFTA